jgi:signal transduction histidine kinase
MALKRKKTVYLLLSVAWILFSFWQIYEHSRVKQAAMKTLLSRARDISSSISVVIRSQDRFGILPQSRIEAALTDLVQSPELQSVALLNASGQVVASAGKPIDVKVGALSEGKEVWERNSVVIMNLVDLGHETDERSTTRTAPIVLKDPDPGELFRDDRRTSGTKVAAQEESHERRSRRRDRSPRRFGRPPWMSEEQYQELLAKQGLHGFLLQMSIDGYRAECARDLWLRNALILFALIASLGLGVAWRNIERSEVFRIRLLKASEMNIHLNEMNLAAAGLAHETRNPLNLVRGQSQIISRDSSASKDVQAMADRIIEEVDRVTGRLNEFINYSRPLAPKPAPTNLRLVTHEVERALKTDMEEKDIRFTVSGPDISIEADESLLRQVLFNLLLNACQAVDKGGMVEVRIDTNTRGEAGIDVCDNGPGVPPEAREEIFRPYYTTREEGTGLGLSVARQIVLAHQWEIECVPEEKGARFRISGMKTI